MKRPTELGLYMDISRVKSAERHVEEGSKFAVRNCMVAAPATQHTDSAGRLFTAVGGRVRQGVYSRELSPDGVVEV